MSKRKYSDEDRATALAAVAANGGNVAKTAKQLDIPYRTLRSWTLKNDEKLTNDCQQKKGMMADAIEDIAWKLLDALPSKIDGAPLNHTATALGIAIDKMRLLRGEPTQIEDHECSHRITEAIRANPNAARAASEFLQQITYRPGENGAGGAGVAGDSGPLGKPTSSDSTE